MKDQQVIQQGFHSASVQLPLEKAAAALIKAKEDNIMRGYETQSRIIYNQNQALLGNKAFIKNEQAPQTPRPGKS